jgi:phosphate-selective porin OprO/OprP
MNRILSALFVTIASAGVASAGGGKQVVDTIAEADKSLCDLFDLATLYSNKENPLVQKFAFTGRLQADAAFFYEGDEEFEELLWRRFRAGFKASVLNGFTVHAEADLDLNDHSPLYNKLTDAYVSWSAGDEFELLIGKQGAKFTMDGATSSKELIRMERSLLSTNMWFPEEYFTGVSATGDVGNWFYNLGFFSSDGGPEFGDFEAGYFGLVSVGYNFKEAFGLDKALVRVDYVNNNPTGRGLLNTRSLHQVGSVNATFEKGNWGLRTDISAAEGYKSQSDLFGLAIMPYYNISDKLQLVASYNYVNSSGKNGVRLDRYESSVVSGRADEAHEFYAGVNYYLCKHKLKWQTGVEYTTAEDAANDGGAYSGWGISSGIRISW